MKAASSERALQESKMDQIADPLFAARQRAYSMPLDEIAPGSPELFRTNTFWPYFERLRAEDPVHWAVASAPEIGGYWSITRYDDIVAVDTDHETFSSEPVIVLPDPDPEFRLPMFIAMDPPKHDEQRATIAPAVSGPILGELAPIIRERAGEILDSLPIGEEFDWVDKVSVELTTMTLATLFDFPMEHRRKLARWSDVATAPPNSHLFETGRGHEQRKEELFECLSWFGQLWNERVSGPPKPDLISMLAQGEATRGMDRMEYLGNLVLLIVGGNDTTRNTLTGSLVALGENPDQEALIRARPQLVPAMVSETIRWQTPLAYMRRTAKRDVEFRGKLIRKGDKVVMWYVSGNRDETVMERPNDFWIERPRVRQHLSFGFGVHRCVGNRLAELQLKIIWEEILKRFPVIEITGAPTHVFSSFVKGYERLPVVIPRQA
jgi:cytochrome P450